MACALRYFITLDEIGFLYGATGGACEVRSCAYEKGKQAYVFDHDEDDSVAVIKACWAVDVLCENKT